MVQLSDVIASAPPETVRVVLRHEARKRFRAVFLLEALLSLVACVCLVPVAVFWMSQSSEAIDFDLERLFRRAWHRWHAVVVVLYDGDGGVLATAEHAPATESDGEALIASVLRVADAQGLVVVETLGDNAEVLAVWTGGQPLLAAAALASESEARAALVAAGAELEELPSGVRVQWSRPRKAAWLAAIGLVVFTPLTLWTRQGRADLQDLWHDLLRRPARHVAAEVSREALVLDQGRGEHGTRRTLSATELLGLAWSPRLGFAPVTRQVACLRIFTRSGGHVLRLPGDPGGGPALRDLALLTLGVGRASRPSRCSYCGTSRVLVETPRCPSCGAPPLLG